MTPDEILEQIESLVDDLKTAVYADVLDDLASDILSEWELADEKAQEILEHLDAKMNSEAVTRMICFIFGNLVEQGRLKGRLHCFTMEEDEHAHAENMRNAIEKRGIGKVKSFIHADTKEGFTGVGFSTETSVLLNHFDIEFSTPDAFED